MKTKREFMVTPAGVVKWAYFLVPDTEYKAEGKFHVKYYLPLDSAEGQAFKAQLDAAIARLVGTKSASKTHCAYKIVNNELFLQPYCYARGINRATKEEFKQELEVVDDKRNPWNPNKPILNGSLVKVKIELVKNNQAKDGGQGINARLFGAQIVKAAEMPSSFTVVTPPQSQQNAATQTEDDPDVWADDTIDFEPVT